MISDRQKQKVVEAALRVSRAKDELQKAEKDFDLALGQVGRSKGRKPTTDRTLDTNGEPLGESEPNTNGTGKGNFSERIAAVLQSNPKKAWKYEEIQQRIPDIKIESLRPLLYRLAKAKKPLARKSGRGKFKATEPELS